MRDNQKILVRRSEFDDVYVERETSVYEPELGSAAQGSRFAKRWLAGAMAVVLMASATGLTYGAPGYVGYSAAYFADTETSVMNIFVAALLDFIGVETPQAYDIEEGAPPVDVPIVITPEVDSLATEYRVTVEETGGVPAFCAALDAAVVSPPFAYSGDLLLLDGTAEEITNITLSLTLLSDVGLTDGDQCMFDVVFRGWYPTMPEYTGFTDEERVSVTITLNIPEPDPIPADIVLNEYLPNPDPTAGGMNFGNDNDSKPLGEWIELYNKGPVAQDIAGWFITDASGGVGNTHAVISTTTTNTGGTIIPAGGWLVVFTNKPSLNNTGDEIYLYPVGSTTPVDFTSYNDPSSDCENDPTQGTGNVGTGQTGTPGNGPNADCVANQVAPNKSYARIPDGTGAWIDPIPTPAAPNELEEDPASPGWVPVEEVTEPAPAPEQEPAPSWGLSGSSIPEPTPGAEPTPVIEEASAETPPLTEEPAPEPVEPEPVVVEPPVPEPTPEPTPVETPPAVVEPPPAE